MIIPYVMLFVVALFSHFELNVGMEDRTKKKVVLALFLVFYLLSFLRWEYGGDWENYYTHFEHYTWESLDQHEIVYMVVLLLAKAFINDYTFVLFCFSSILFYFQIKGVSKLSILPLTTLLILTGTYFCNVAYIRQNISVAIAFYSLIYVIQRRMVPYLICVILAFGFHYSALVFLPAYWIYNLSYSRKQLILFLLISVFLSSVMIFFLQGIGNLIGVAGIVSRAENYLDQGFDYEDGSTLNARQLIIKACINRGYVVLIGFYLVGKVRGSDSWSFYNGLLNLYCFGTILFFMSSPLHIALTRMTWYFDIFQLLIIPGFFLYVNERQRYLLFLLLVAMMTLKLYMNVNSSTDDTYAVYKFIPSIERVFN